MSGWIREIAGWMCIAIGLTAFFVCYRFLSSRWIFEAGPIAFMGFVIFRGGIHLLKVAIAARICREALIAKPMVRSRGPSTPLAKIDRRTSTRPPVTKN